MKVPLVDKRPLDLFKLHKVFCEIMTRCELFDYFISAHIVSTALILLCGQ